MKEKTLISKDGYILHLDIYEAKEPKGYIQIIHGMQEHKERYFKIAKFLEENGYTVIVSNIRGHGKDAPIASFFKEKEGYKYLLSDQIEITNYICDNYNADKVIIMAHSMGTIIARNLLKTESNKYEKVILMGYVCPQHFVNLGIFVTNLIIKIKGPEYTSKIVERYSVNKYNRTIKNAITKSDWISFNKENVQNFINDKYCGIAFTVSAYNDVFHLLNTMVNKNNCKNINKNISILLLRGEGDPCIGGEKGSNNSINILRKFGFNNIKDIKYKNMRHEVLNEVNSNTVYNDIINFLNN